MVNIVLFLQKKRKKGEERGCFVKVFFERCCCVCFWCFVLSISFFIIPSKKVQVKLGGVDEGGEGWLVF